MSRRVSSERRRKLHLRIQVAAIVAALRGVVEIGAFVFLAPYVAEELADFVNASRVAGLLAASILNLTCAAIVWRRRSLIAANVLAAFSSLDAIYRVALGRSPLVSAACAIVYVVASLAIRELRREQLPDTPRKSRSQQ